MTFMNPSMFCCSDNHQVFDSVIVRIFVDVMNKFMLAQRSFQEFFHYPSVLSLSFSIFLHSNIGIIRKSIFSFETERSKTFPKMSVFANIRAIHFSVSATFHMAWRNVKVVSTFLTLSINSLSFLIRRLASGIFSLTTFRAENFFIFANAIKKTFAPITHTRHIATI